MSPSLLAKALRHKDPATAIRYYNFRETDEVRFALDEFNLIMAKTGAEIETTFDEFIGFYERIGDNGGY